MSAAILPLPIRVPDDLTTAEACAQALARGLALVIDRHGRAVMKPQSEPGDIVIVPINEEAA